MHACNPGKESSILEVESAHMQPTPLTYFSTLNGAKLILSTWLILRFPTQLRGWESARAIPLAHYNRSKINIINVVYVTLFSSRKNVKNRRYNIIKSVFLLVFPCVVFFQGVIFYYIFFYYCSLFIRFWYC